MNILSLSPEELSRVAPEQLQEAVKRLAPEEVKQLTREQQARVMEAFDPRWRLSPTEQKRCDAARTLVDPQTWQQTISTLVESILQSGKLGHLTEAEALAIVKRVSIGCWPQTRAQLVGTTALLFPSEPNVQRRKPGATRPVYPECIKSGTADLILYLKRKNHKLRVKPGVLNRDMYDPSSPVIEEALRLLTILQWFGDAPTPAPTTIDDWVRKRKREQLPPDRALPKGRPSHQKKK